ncbi:two-component system, OmpR family, response regulator PrrA [Nonomuraea maritima]|uniref:Two-component system, OmpR family, response regulator PrrA n=1 Tax=Nonomuraea maritima TaxID=683260 RepID=A0A1G8XZW5_9ACTN|nr:response regulator transcription factor [Nonomuraea maritima]SDJ96129.1 two-component system, OmpR family, response regulator PrrA [Nonomuraea maritima]
MTAYRLIVVDDDQMGRLALYRGLRMEGFVVETAATGPLALELFDEVRPDAIVLDASMPGMSGVEVCRRLRAAGARAPVLLLSDRDEVDERVAGPAAGADDCVVRPFDVYELARRLRALLRRNGYASGPALTVGPLTVEPAAHRVTLDGREVRLAGRGFRLLEELARNAGIVMPRPLLLERVWGYDFEIAEDSVDAFVGYLRRELEAGGRARMLHTVRGAGFELREPRP